MAGVKEQIAALQEGIRLYLASNFPQGDEGMAIDISKIKPGDKVTLVPLEVDVIFPNSIRVGSRASQDGWLWVTPDQIADWHPAPREFQVGDRVRVTAEADGGVGTVRGVDGEEVWVRWPDAISNWGASASALTLVEAGQ